MLKHTPSAHPRRVWIALSILAVAALVGTFLMVVRSGGQGVSRGPAAPSPSPTARTGASAMSTPDHGEHPASARHGARRLGTGRGMTNHLEFARKVATLLLAYDASTDFAARNTDLLRAAAPTPYGNPTGLAETLAAYTPTGAGLDSIKATNTTVTVSLSDVSESDWAARKLDGFAIPHSGADQLVFAVCTANCEGCGADEVVQYRGFMPCHRSHREDLCGFDGLLVGVAHGYSLLPGWVRGSVNGRADSRVGESFGMSQPESGAWEDVRTRRTVRPRRFHRPGR